MQKLLDSAGGAAVAAGETSQIIHLGSVDYFQVTIVGDISTGTLTLQQRLDSTWYTFAPGGSSQTFTNTTLGSATATHTETYIVGECDMRFSLADAGTIAIYVGGTQANPVNPLRP
jgi:hypothetical protein